MVSEVDLNKDKGASLHRCFNKVSHLHDEKEVWVGLSQNQKSFVCWELWAKQGSPLSLCAKNVVNLQSGSACCQHWRDLGASNWLQTSLLEQTRRKQFNGRQSYGTQSQHDSCYFIRGWGMVITDSVQYWRKCDVDVPFSLSQSIYEAVWQLVARVDNCSDGRRVISQECWDSKVHKPPWNEGSTKCSIQLCFSTCRIVVRSLQEGIIQS